MDDELGWAEVWMPKSGSLRYSMPSHTRETSNCSYTGRISVGRDCSMKCLTGVGQVIWSLELH
jgi:hypothetical protein